MDQATGTVFNIQRYSLHDGPGIRTTVFLKGCPLSCAWCHNPESISAGPEILVAESRCIDCGACRASCPLDEARAGTGALPARMAECDYCGACIDACPTGARQMVGRRWTVDEVVAEVLKDRIFHEESGGGVTISGGEPLLQMAFLRELLPALREQGVHIALDTSGFGHAEHLREGAQLADLVLYDLKAYDDQRHRILTGVSNWHILENLKVLDAAHDNIWIRVPVVPGFTDDPDELRQLAALVAGMRHVTRVNLLPYHRAAGSKYTRMGRVNALSAVQVPSPDDMQRAAACFADLCCPVQLGG